MQKAFRLSLVATVGVVVLAACGSDSPSTAASSSSGGSSTGVLGGTTWDLASYKGSGSSATSAAKGVSAPLAFADNKVEGSTGCNQFSGTYTESGASLKIDLGPMTQKACADAAVNAQESALVTLFGQVTGFEVDAGTLTLKGAGGTLLTYTAGLGGLEGTEWQATGVNNGKGAVVSTALTESLTAKFDANGEFSGFGGCNSLSGKYETTGTDGLTITNLVGTKISCGAETDTLEAQYSAALETVSTYAIAGDQLTLRASDGSIQASYTRSG